MEPMASLNQFLRDVWGLAGGRERQGAEATAKPARVQRAWAERSPVLGAAPAWPRDVFGEESVDGMARTPAVPRLRSPGDQGRPVAASVLFLLLL